MNAIDLDKVFIKNINENDKITHDYMRTIKTYSAQEFEEFICEWVKFCRYRGKKINAYNIGGTGDHGIDIMVYCGGKEVVYQCKRYTNCLNEGMVAQIITKILWHYFIDTQHSKYPSEIYIAALSNYSIIATRMLEDETKLKSEIKLRITKSLKAESITYTSNQLKEFRNYLEKFDYKNVGKLDINTIIYEYSHSEIAFSRFRNVTIEIKRRDAITTVKQLPNIYKQQIEHILAKTTMSQAKKDSYLKSAEADFYSAVSLRETCFYFLGDTKEFEKIENDILSYINIEKFNTYNSDFERMQAILSKSITAITSDSYLDYCIHLVNNDDRKGTCHWLVNNDKFKWEN